VAGISTPIMSEIERALAKPYFVSRLTAPERHRAIAELRMRTRLAEPLPSIAGVATHKEDDLVIATAVALDADCIVSRDIQLLQLGSYQNVRMLSPLTFLTFIDEQMPRGLNPSGQTR
jgi:predicted nucleic acid-binding protein